ncbi:MAG: response regulator [candidate division Zixibacteria bacterium]|jgi:CheY-like chemotaxis protein|nr:response regulator [candidate division Zixibacteria bacterium]
MSILVIGQDEETVKAISSALDDSECPVQRAADGTEGFARLSSRAQYKLIITDLAMPGMDGFQLLKVVRGNPRLRGTPVLVCSASCDAPTVLKAIEAGAEDFIAKPVESDSLRDKLHRLVSDAYADVLIVDDDPVIRDLLMKILHREGFSAVAAAGVDAAIEVLKTTRVSIVISDIEMPERSGLDLLKHIRENLPRLPVLMITGKSEKYGQGKILSAGASGFIAKPFKNTEIVEKLISLL